MLLYMILGVEMGVIWKIITLKILILLELIIAKIFYKRLELLIQSISQFSTKEGNSIFPVNKDLYQ